MKRYMIIIQDKRSERLIHSFAPEGTDNRETAITWLRIALRLWKDGDAIRFYDGTLGMQFVNVEGIIKTKLLI